MSTARDAGLAALQSGDIQTAISQLEAAVQENPSDFDACLYLGGAYGQAGRALDAIKTVTQAVQLQPANAQARYNLAVAMEQGGYAEQAAQVYGQAVQLQPDYPKAKEAIARLHAASNQGFGAAVSSSPSTAGSGQQFQEQTQQPAAQPQVFAQPAAFGQQTQQQAPFNPLAPEPEQAQPTGYSPLTSPPPSAQPTGYNPLAPAPQQSMQPTQAFASPVQPQQPVEAGLGSYMAPPPPAARPAAGYGAPAGYAARPGAYSSAPSYDDQFSIGQGFKDLFRALFKPRELLSEMAGCDTSRSAWALFVVYGLLMALVYVTVGIIVGAKAGVLVMGLLGATLYTAIGIVSLLVMWAFYALVVHMMSRAFGSSLRFGASMRCVIIGGAPSVVLGLISILCFGLVASSAIGLVKSTPGMMDSITSAATSTSPDTGTYTDTQTSGKKPAKSKSAKSNPFAANSGSTQNPFASTGSNGSNGSNPFSGAGTPGASPFTGAGGSGPNPFGAAGAPGSDFGAQNGPAFVLFQQIAGAYMLLGLLGLVSSVWAMVLLGAAISNIHEISGGSAAGVVVLSGLIYIVVLIGLAILASIVFGMAFASMFSAMAAGMH